MNMSAKFRERILRVLNFFYTTGLTLLYLVIIFTIIVCLDLLFNEKKDATKTLAYILMLTPQFIIFYILSKSLFPRLFEKGYKIDGIIIKREDFPQLYATIDEIRAMCKCPKIHVIALDYGNNAYIIEGSRSYLKKWKKRYLIIGIPILLLLNERELKSVIAHECSHLSKFHSRRTIRILDKMKDLVKKLDKLTKKGKYDSIKCKFIKQHIILLNDLYFQLSKEHELEADLVATKVVSKQSLINSLLKLDFYDGIFSNFFWNGITELNKTDQEIPDNVFFMMENSMKGSLEVPKEVYKKFLDEIRTYRSLPGSTHPSIVERAEALGASIPTLESSFNGDLISIFKDTYESSIRTLFKLEATNILNTMSLKWSEVSRQRWNEYYKYICDMRTSLQDLEAIGKDNALTHKQWVDKGFIIEELQNRDAALEVFREAEDADELNIGAKFHVARILLQNNENEGVEILKNLMEKDIQLIPDCCYLLVNYYLYNKNIPEAVNYYNFAVNFMNTNDEAKAERTYIYRSDEFIPHDLSSKTLDKIKAEILKYKEIKKAYISIKKLNLTKDFPVYVIALKYEKFYSKKKAELIQKDLNKVLNDTKILPWDFHIVQLTWKNINIEYNIDTMLNTRIL